jgi:ribosomal protein L37AE/L43A
MRKILTMKMS